MGRLLASMLANLPDEDRALLEDYAAALRRAGYCETRLPSKVSRNSSGESAGASTLGNHLWAVRRFLRRWGLQGWLDLPIEEQVRLLTTGQPQVIASGLRRFVCWLALTGRQPFPAGFLAALEREMPAGIRWIEVGRLAWPERLEHLTSTARKLGYVDDVAHGVCHTVTRAAAQTGKTPAELTMTDLLGLSEAVRQRQTTQRAEQGQPPPAYQRRRLWPWAAGAVLYHAGLWSQPPDPHLIGRQPGPATEEARLGFLREGWPALHAVTIRYLAQRRTTLRPSTVKGETFALAAFFRWLTQHHPEVTELAQLERRGHIEPFLHWMRDEVEPGCRMGQGKWSLSTRHHTLTCLRRFFHLLALWGWPEAPNKPLLLPGDVPRLPDPLPQAFDDVDAARMVQLARTAADPLERLVIELLAGCGLRRGEAHDLKLSDIVTFGDQPAAQPWLRVPVGKLGNDRYVPIGPELQAALDAFLQAERSSREWERLNPPPDWTAYLLARKGRRVSANYCNTVVHRIAERAGVSHAHAHRWRHTFATQAINRGMDLATIATLLGHTTLEMTMVYARIANPTLRKEFERVSHQVQAFYTAVATDPPGPETPVTLPPGALGPAMAITRRELEWRRLGNGWCTRRAYLDCRYELVCERCVHFNTDRLFLPVLEAQYDDALRKGQHARTEMFRNLVSAVKAAEQSGDAVPVVSGSRLADFSNPNTDPRSVDLAMATE